ncbi:SDR family NAD(P)-dependent oxidoreductase [Rhodococcus oryzae]|uniref:SDR family NAD(P)-dependent oxidoreductase n=1 Tax=Rhodococcus oryzae TaxID=2571143 RepID=UPI003716B960
MRFGGLNGAGDPSPFEVVERMPMYRLRRYFSGNEVDHGHAATGRPVALLIPTLMLSAEVYDMDTDEGAVATLHRAGIDPWVLDFGSPALEEGGWDRDIADHVLAVSEAIDTIFKETGRDVHLLGYSQGGMFAYQAAAYRRGAQVASIVTFGSPVDLDAATLPWGLPSNVVGGGADILATCVAKIRVTDRMLRTWFDLMDPIATTKRRIAFIRQLHDREALLPWERRRRFLARDGWVGYSGPAIADFLRQFVGNNRMASGSFLVRDKLATLAGLTCPILAFVGQYDVISTPASVRAVARAAPRASVYESDVVASHFGLVAGSGATRVTWPTAAKWIRWLEKDEPRPESIRELSSGEDSATKLARYIGSLANRNVLITGASSGIGRAAALAVAAEGATVLLIARRGPELDEVVGDIRAGGGIAFGYQCDLTQSDSVAQAVIDILDNHGHVDMLVNNAGRSIRRTLDHSVDRLHDFERTMAINYFGALRLILALLPSMRERGFGHIVNVSTGAVQVGVPRFAAYLASKAALNKFTDVAAAETLNDRVTFTTIHMPLVDTPMIEPTDYRSFNVRSPQWAAGLIVKALTKRPKRIQMVKASLWEHWSLIAPGHRNRILNQRFIESSDH